MFGLFPRMLRLEQSFVLCSFAFCSFCKLSGIFLAFVFYGFIFCHFASFVFCQICIFREISLIALMQLLKSLPFVEQSTYGAVNSHQNYCDVAVKKCQGLASWFHEKSMWIRLIETAL